MTPALSVRDVARYFLAKQDDGDISNLKLQKLCYYAQGMSLALRGRPLWAGFRIKAWKDGPVVPDLWHTYKAFGWSAIPRVTDLDESQFESSSREILDMVFASFGKLPAKQLSEMTHVEKPWQDAHERAQAGGDDAISEASLREFFGQADTESRQMMAQAIWGHMRATQPDWDAEAERSHLDITEGKGISLGELRRRRSM